VPEDVTFEWDSAKADENLRKHGVSFEDAATAFADPLSVTVRDPDHSETEHRFALVGRTTLGALVVVIHAERGENIRIISARRATPSEVRSHEQDAE
jgi:uncharacterized DUF497 family protein